MELSTHIAYALPVGKHDLYAAPVAKDALVDDLSTLVVRLVRALRKASPDSDLPAKALEYLYRKDLAPSVLRGGMSGNIDAALAAPEPKKTGE